MLLYFLKTILILGLFYMLYLFFLRSNKTFKWNRIYLLATSILALILPFINTISFIKKSIIAQPNQPLSITLQNVNVYATNLQAKELDFAKIILGIYVVGLIWGILRMTLGFLVIKRIKESSRLEKTENDLVYFNKNIESPFSFNSNIYIPDSFRNKDVLKIILKHEKAHVQLKHSRDKIYFSILQALCWFNPFVYFYHKEIELVHEFEADEFSTQEFTTDDYVENLLKTIKYTQTPTLLAHHFFQHPLKTRIIMLYSKSKNALVQKAIVIVTGIIICSTLLIIQSYGQDMGKNKEKFTFKIKTYQSDTIEVENPETKEISLVITNPKSDTIYDFVDQMPEFYGGEDEMLKYLTDNIKYPKASKKNKISGRVIIQFIINENGEIKNVEGKKKPKDGEELEQEAIRVVNNMPKWKPGKHNGKPVKVEYTLPISFQLGR